jgi:hypothetical protein
VILDSGRSVRDGDTAGGSVAQTLIGPLLRPLAEHPGRFTMAVDCAVYWRAGGYRADASNPDPLSLLRIVRRATGRVAVADSRRVIPPVRFCPERLSTSRFAADGSASSADSAALDASAGSAGPAGPIGSAGPADSANSADPVGPGAANTEADGAWSTVGRSMAALWERSLSLARGWPG